MTWQTPVFIIIALAAGGYSSLKFATLLKLMKAHRPALGRTDRMGDRILATILNVLGQRAVLRKPWIGIAHATIFWGFLIITIGTLEQFATTIHSDAYFTFVGDSIYRAWLFLHDFFTGAIILALAFAAYRRYIVRPQGLGKSKDANFVLVFTFSLMVSIFLMHGFGILSGGAGHDAQYASSMPFSKAVSEFLGVLPISQESAAVLHTIFKWIHMLLVLGFGMFIPGSKHLHVVAAGPNTFLQKLDREKGMKPINFEDASIEQYGAAKVTDLSWKDVLDYYSCTECGRCQDLCPAYNTQKPLSPKALIMDLKENLYHNKTAILSGKTDEVGPLINSQITEDVIWACTSCRACEIACPVFIEHTDKIYEARRNLVMMESKFPAEVQAVFKNMETNAAPWAFSASDRANWAEGLNVKTLAQDPSVDVLLWVGCAGSFDDRNKKVLRAFVNVLKKAEVRFAILGSEEKCTGDAARRIGNEYLFQSLAKDNIETLNRYGVKKIVTACPHCFNTLKNEYRDFGGNYEVTHHSQFLASLIAQGKIKPNRALEETVTFHDSCYMGRWNGVYAEPRGIISAIPSARMVEMSQHHDQSMCCGAGGGRMWMEETIGKRINVTRTEQALASKAGVIASSCPFCMTMLTDGVKSKEMQDKVKVVDIAELVDQSTT
jgi:Fe-S oxidoreductase